VTEVCVEGSLLDEGGKGVEWKVGINCFSIVMWVNFLELYQI
jgi:hypothetical protein